MSSSQYRPTWMSSGGNGSSANAPSATDDNRVDYQGKSSQVTTAVVAAIVNNSAALAKPELGAEKWLASVMADRKAGRTIPMTPLSTLRPYLHSDPLPTHPSNTPSQHIPFPSYIPPSPLSTFPLSTFSLSTSSATNLLTALAKEARNFLFSHPLYFFHLYYLPSHCEPCPQPLQKKRGT